MKIIEGLIQGSKEWKSFRLKHLGASNCAAILGVSPHQTKREFWEQMTGRSFEFFQGNKYTEYGKKMEPLIREEYSRFKNMEFTTPTAEDDTHPFISASYDAYNSESNLIAEFKASMYPKLERCIRENNVNEVKDLYPHYYYQIQQQIYIANAASCDLATLSGSGDLLIVEIPRDEVFIADMVKGLVKFWKTNIKKDVPPPPDIITLTALEATAKASELSVVMDKIKVLKEREIDLRDSLISMGDDGDFEVGSLTFKRTKPRAKFDKDGLYLEFFITKEDIKRFTKNNDDDIGFYKVSKK